MLIKVEQFTGIIPKAAPHLLPVNAAQIARNAKIYSGALRPWKEPLAGGTPYKTGTILSIYIYNSGWMLHWLTDVDCVRGPLANDAYNRVYWTGDVLPRMSVAGVVNAGPDYPTGYYILGVPVPLTSPSPTVNGEAGSAEDAETRYYVYTYVSAYGEEGPPCLASIPVTWYPGNTVTLSNLATGPSGNYNITHKNIYRTNMGSDGTAYQLVDQIPVANTTFTDDVDSDALGSVLPSLLWDAPDEDMIGLIALPNGSLAGIIPDTREVCFSEPYRPHAWPISYRIPLDHTPVALGVFGSSLLVGTTGMPYLITGDTPGSMFREKLEIGQACVSKRGMVDMGDYLIYPAPDGLVRVSSDTLDLATANILGRNEWKWTYYPASIHAYYYMGCYLGFYDTGSKQAGFIFDPNSGAFIDLDFYATAGYSDMSTGLLHLVINGQYFVIDSGTESLSFTWKSRPFISPYPVNLGVGQVLADTYTDLTLKVYANGELKHTQIVRGNSPFRLPSGFKATHWEFEVTGTDNVNTILLASTMSELSKAQNG